MGGWLRRKSWRFDSPLPPVEVQGRLAAIVGPPGDPESELLVGWSREGAASLEERHHKGGGAGFKLLLEWSGAESGSQVTCRFQPNRFYVVFMAVWAIFALMALQRMPEVIEAFRAGAEIPLHGRARLPAHQLFGGMLLAILAFAIPFIVRWNIVHGRRDLVGRAVDALAGGPVVEVRE